MPIAGPPEGRGGGWRAVVAALLLVVAVGGPGMAAPPPSLEAGLAGFTLSAVTYVPRQPGQAAPADLSRVMFQAYLGNGGRALVRVWDVARDAYTLPAATSWTLTGSKLCLEVPQPGPGPICADIHIWGPRIAGIGIDPYVMLDGDLQRGNALRAR